MTPAALRLLSLLLLLPGVASAETCRFEGETSHGGRLTVRAQVSEAGPGELALDMTVTFAIRALGADVRYYGQEISTWRDGALTSVAVNQRTIIDGGVKRQQWDVFTLQGGRLEAYRAQAKRLDDFRARHPALAAHWGLAAFGQPWLADFRAAAPERRPDLDLPLGPATRPPLAFAFFWSRFLPASGGTATLVLPSFKHDRTVPLRLSTALDGPGWRRWSAPLVHPGLDASPPSLAAAWVSADGYLLQLGVELHTSWASGLGVLKAAGCQGVQIRPAP